MKHANILETIGKTPIIRINRLAPEGVNVYVKAEAFNPMGSVKDRLALGVIEDAEKSGALKPGQTVIEATSGNTGLGLAMVCAQKGYPLVVTMAESFSIERRRMMRFLGAKVVLTPAHLKGTGMLAKAIELAEEHGWFLTRQFSNESNPNMHSRTTAREILADFEGETLDYWVTGFGTGGTLKGVSRVLKAESPATKVMVCEPDNSALIASGIAQKRTDDGEIAEGHPAFRPHLMQGWTPDFIPSLVEDVMEEKWYDDTVMIDGQESLDLSRELAQKEGIFTGISGGATFAGALEIARGAAPGTNILCMLPDTGERYLSTPLFADIPAEMTEDEVALSKSTPGYRFDVQQSSAVAASAPVELDDAAIQFVNDTTASKDLPVAVFGLEWCEFCGSVRSLFEKLEIAFEEVEMDSAALQENDKGAKIRAALNEKTKCKTVPQIFVGGEFVGGATDVFDLYNAGDLQPKLKAAGVSFDETAKFDAYSMLPTWLHPR